MSNASASIRIGSSSAAETKRIGKAFAEELIREKSGPHIILLEGDLGTGKTTFTLGFLSFFGIRPHAASPTFVLMKIYRPKSRKKGIDSIAHVDAYRLRTKQDLEGLRIPALEHDERSAVLIEWPKQIGLRPPKGSVLVRFGYGTRENERILEIHKK